MALTIALLVPMLYVGKRLGWSHDAINGCGWALMIGSILLHLHLHDKARSAERDRAKR
jgi:hypothetical protein